MPYLGWGRAIPYLGRGLSGTVAGVVGATVGWALGAAEVTVVGAAEGVAEAAGATGVGSAVAGGATVGAAEAALAAVSIGTSGVGLFSELQAAAETDAATIMARPAARRAQKGQAAPAAMWRWQRAHGTRSRIGGERTSELAAAAPAIGGIGGRGVMSRGAAMRRRHTRGGDLQ